VKPFPTRLRPALRAAALTLLVVQPGLAASPPELVTDRPDRTESAALVPRDFIQLEAGWSHGERNADDVEATLDSFPEALLRVGLGRRWELRVGFGGFRRLEIEPVGGADERESGAADLAIGFKLKLAEERGWRPQMAFLGTLTLPTGTAGFSRDRADPALVAVFSHDLGERLGLGYNIGVESLTEEDDGGERDTQTEVLWTVSLGIGSSGRLAGFVELFGGFGLSRSVAPDQAFDGGLTWLVRDNLQLDAFAGVGLSDSADDWFAGTGLSYRFPE